METKTIYIETYGCTANQNNTEIMSGLLQQSGLNLTSNINNADIIILNTCIVKEPTENKIKRRIQDLKKLYKDKKLIIAGCMPSVRKAWLKSQSAYLLDTSHTLDIVNLIIDIEKNKYKEEKYLAKKHETKLCKTKNLYREKTGITQISEGCLGNCTFCLTKLVKGNLFSYPQEQILKNIQQDLQSGAREIWITSQDNASYNIDNGEQKLPELLKKIINLKGNFKIRIGMMNPENVLPILSELIEIYKNKKIIKFLHLPLQAGSNKILKLMNRKYTTEQFLKIVESFRKTVPDLTFSTDIIAGFPEETDSDFQETINIVKKLKPEKINITRFWAMKPTLASTLPQIPREIIKQRIKILQETYKSL